MAKRIKIKGKAPRGPRKLNGLSKRARVIGHHWEQSVGDDSPMETWPTEVLRAIAKVPKGASTTPSSEIKKLVKEGNRKFIGPRPLKEFDPYEEIDSPDESEHRLSRGYTKSHRRSDEAEFLRRRPQNQKLSRAEQNMLKGDIARSATSKEGKLLNKLLSALRAQERESFLAKYREIPF